MPVKGACRLFDVVAECLERRDIEHTCFIEQAAVLYGRYGLACRGAMRSRFGDQFDLYGSDGEPGYANAIAPLFELHEPRNSRNALPSQYWRARISLVQSYGFLLGEKYMLRIGGLLTHESYHETAHTYSRPDFLGAE